MHLALFVSGLAGGGAQRRMITLAHGFARRGHAVDLVAAHGEGPYLGETFRAIRLVPLDNRWQRLPALRDRRGLWVPASTLRLASYLRSRTPDALLSASTPANLTALWARLCAGVATPVAISVNVDLCGATAGWRSASRWALRGLVRRFYPRADGVIAISHGVARSVVKLAAVPPERVFTIHNPVDSRLIAAHAKVDVDPFWLRSDQVPFVLGVGKLKAQKDFATLIRAFARVRAHRPLRLVILGEGEQRAALLRLASDLGVAADVALPGFVSNPYAWMARAAVFALSSAWEGFSNALAEALAVGCPVVSTDCPSGPREILDGGTYGPLVPVGDDRALAAAILSVLRAPPKPALLQARASAFSVDAAVDRYLEVLRDVSTAGERISRARPTEPDVKAVWRRSDGGRHS